jgi:hypothetical protein
VSSRIISSMNFSFSLDEQTGRLLAPSDVIPEIQRRIRSHIQLSSKLVNSPTLSESKKHRSHQIFRSNELAQSSRLFTTTHLSFSYNGPNQGAFAPSQVTPQTRPSIQSYFAPESERQPTGRFLHSVSVSLSPIFIWSISLSFSLNSLTDPPLTQVQIIGQTHMDNLISQFLSLS